jgi:hypothetical protein
MNLPEYKRKDSGKSKKLPEKNKTLQRETPSRKIDIFSFSEK